MNPRNRYYHVLLFGHTFLLLLAVLLLWCSNRRATTTTRRALAGFDRRLVAVSNLVSSTSGPPSDKVRRDPVGVSAPASSTASSGVSDWRLVPPRVLGSGRSRAWCYVDVRYGDGATCRHYVRTNATPREVKVFVRDLAFQAESHSWVCDAPYAFEK